jgi:hypothetical protein
MFIALLCHIVTEVCIILKCNFITQKLQRFDIIVRISEQSAS